MGETVTLAYEAAAAALPAAPTRRPPGRAAAGGDTLPAPAYEYGAQQQQPVRIPPRAPQQYGAQPQQPRGTTTLPDEAKNGRPWTLVVWDALFPRVVHRVLRDWRIIIDANAGGTTSR